MTMTNRLSVGSRMAYLVLAWLYVVAIVVQVLLIGLNLFAGEPTRDAHVGFGHFIGVLPILMLIVAFAGRLPGPAKALAGWQFGLFILQAEVFAAIRGAVPVLAGFHPVLAMIVFALAVYAARQALAWVRVPSPATAVAERAPV
jgi:hypothetical protein